MTSQSVIPNRTCYTNTLLNKNLHLLLFSFIIYLLLVSVNTVKAAVVIAYSPTVQNIYIAYYGRPADPAGLDYWTNRLESAGGDLDEIIESFANAPETESLYGGLDNRTKVNAIYQQLFGRDSEAAGLDYYAERLANGESTHANIMLDILNGAVNSDAAIAAKKLDAARRFSNGLNTPDEIAQYSADNAAAIRAWLATITVNTIISEVSTDITDILGTTGSTSLTCSNDGSLAAPATGVTEKTLTQTIDDEQVIRRYLIHVPTNINPGQCYPVLFALHGAGGNPDGYQFVLRDLVNAGEFIGIYPAGYLGFWNLGQEPSTADDVAFLEAVADDLAQYGNIDHTRRYVYGNSNGAGMAHKLAGQSDYFRAIAPVVTSLTTTNQPSDKTKQPSVLQILGENDPLVPYQGGTGVAGHEFLPGDESAQLWAEHNDCNLTPEITPLSDGSIRTTYTACANDGEVINYKVANAAHNIPDTFAGDLHALIWDFLSRH